MAEEALQVFGKLYDVEREARELSSEQRQRMRQLESKPITDKLRRFAKTVTTAGVELFFADRKLYEIAALASSENWAATLAYVERLQRLLEEILKEGRESGAFERTTALDETRRSIFYALMPFIDPLFLERSLNLLPEAQVEVTGLVLRSLSP